MFNAHCPTHGGQILLSNRHIEALHNTVHGIKLHWRCLCGTRGTLLTGVPAGRAPQPASARHASCTSP
jgi:hypothetical protein